MFPPAVFWRRFGCSRRCGAGRETLRKVQQFLRACDGRVLSSFECGQWAYSGLLQHFSWSRGKTPGKKDCEFRKFTSFHKKPHPQFFRDRCPSTVLILSKHRSYSSPSHFRRSARPRADRSNPEENSSCWSLRRPHILLTSAPTPPCDEPASPDKRFGAFALPRADCVPTMSLGSLYDLCRTIRNVDRLPLDVYKRAEFVLDTRILVQQCEEGLAKDSDGRRERACFEPGPLFISSSSLFICLFCACLHAGLRVCIYLDACLFSRLFVCLSTFVSIFLPGLSLSVSLLCLSLSLSVSLALSPSLSPSLLLWLSFYPCSPPPRLPPHLPLLFILVAALFWKRLPHRWIPTLFSFPRHQCDQGLAFLEHQT